MSQRLQEETESRRKMADKLSHEHHKSQKEKESTQEVRPPTASVYSINTSVWTKRYSSDGPDVFSVVFLKTRFLKIC